MTLRINNVFSVEFEVPTGMNIIITVVYNVTQCRLVDTY
jgi:hypothetical protein